MKFQREKKEEGKEQPCYKYEDSLEEQLKAGDEEYNKRSSGESEKVVNINRSREYRRKQRVSREQLNPIEHKNKDSKDKENQKDNEGPDKD